MSVGQTYDTFTESPYLTVAEYKNAPTALNVSNLVAGGNLASQDAELSTVIMRASSYMNEYFNQNLVAATNTETQRTRITPQGWISLHPNNSYLIALTDFQYGIDPLNLITLPDVSKVWFEQQQIIIPLYQNWMSSAGPLSLGFPPSNRSQIFCKYTYVSGFVNTLCTGTQGATTVTVADGTGVQVGANMTIYDGHLTEQVTVDSSYVFGSTTIPITQPLQYNHNNVAFGNLPDAVKQACILLTSAFIKRRGDAAMVMQSSPRPGIRATASDMYADDIRLALDMVDKFRRIR